MNERHNYPGSCHCGRVRFELRGHVTGALDCNCSYCRRVGALWWATSNEGLLVQGGGENLVLYQFGTRVAQHYFCRHCGVSPFSRPRLDPTRWAVNLRCVEDLDLATLPIRPFDGRNWEETARAFAV